MLNYIIVGTKFVGPVIPERIANKFCFPHSFFEVKRAITSLLSLANKIPHLKARKVLEIQ